MKTLKVRKATWRAARTKQRTQIYAVVGEQIRKPKER